MPYSLKGRNVLVTGGSRSVSPHLSPLSCPEVQESRPQSIYPAFRQVALRGRDIPCVPGLPYPYYTSQLIQTLIVAATSGLGELICLKFAAEGCNVAVNYNASEDRAKEVAEKVRRFGGKAVLVKGVCLLSYPSNSFPLSLFHTLLLFPNRIKILQISTTYKTISHHIIFMIKSIQPPT